jgi:hypothetical protein
MSTDLEVAALRREVAQLRKEMAILKFDLGCAEEDRRYSRYFSFDAEVIGIREAQDNIPILWAG